ncbi:MAG: phosphate ABC transporter substrate-binding/OmpA family protein [bacterium]
MKKGPTILVALIVVVFAALLYWRMNSNGVISPGGQEQISRVIDRPIRVGIVTWGGYAGGIMENNGFKASKKSDFYRDYGIEVDLKVIDDFVQSRSAFKAGGDKDGIDIVWATVDAYALEYPALRELKPVTIMQYDWSRGGDAIAVDGNIIKSAQDLKGKSISVAEDTPSHYFALFVLDEAGLRPSDVKWRFTNSAIDAANVFKAGRTDATVSWSPDVYIAAEKRSSGRILMSTREATHLIADIFVARGDFVEKYPEAVKRFVNGWLDGVDKVHQDPKPVVKLMADGFGLSMDDSDAMLLDVHLPNYADNMNFFDSMNNPVSYDAVFNKASKLWQDLGKLDKIYSAKESRNTSFLLDIGHKFRNQEPADKIVLGPRPTGGGETLITKRVTINFPSGVAELNSQATSVVRNEVSQFVATYGGCFVSIEGNTDNTGGYDLNKRLSMQRANAVKDLLVREYNMPSDRFDVKGNAWDKPVASNATAAGRAKNRRTDIVIQRFAQFTAN